MAAIEGFIGDARARMQARPELFERPENFLESMLAAQAEGRYSDEEVVGNTLTMLIAGEDTTAHSLAWASFLLAGDPAAQERLAAEALDVLGHDRTPQRAEAADAMRFGEAVLREAMRLKSTAPIILVEPLADTTVAGVDLPAGTRVATLTRQAGLAERRVALRPRPLARRRRGHQGLPDLRRPARASARAATSRSWRARPRWRCWRATSRSPSRGRRRASTTASRWAGGPARRAARA